MVWFWQVRLFIVGDLIGEKVEGGKDKVPENLGKNEMVNSGLGWWFD